MRSLARLDSPRWFSQIIQAKLLFRGLSDRHEGIPEAHQNTFRWILEEESSRPYKMLGDGFTEWLQSPAGNHIYWITGTSITLSAYYTLTVRTGQPGSGKSTLMKYIYNDKRTKTLLNKWSTTNFVVVAGFFFWNSGTSAQRSRLGLLSTLLHDALQQLPNPEIVCQIFPQRWRQFEVNGGGRQAFDFVELHHAFNRMISLDDQLRFFFVIDGLDEYGGKCKEIIDLVTAASSRSNVKICAASRPLPQFVEAFNRSPYLLLEHINRQDISNYVSDKFLAVRYFNRLKQMEPE